MLSKTVRPLNFKYHYHKHKSYAKTFVRCKQYGTALNQELHVNREVTHQMEGIVIRISRRWNFYLNWYVEICLLCHVPQVINRVPSGINLLHKSKLWKCLAYTRRPRNFILWLPCKPFNYRCNLHFSPRCINLHEIQTQQ